MLRWMSFNVRYSRAKDGSQGWGHRKKLVVERIRAFDPDLLGMQECRDDEQSEYLRANLPEYHFIGIPRSGDGPTADEMAPVWFKQSVFELLESGVFWLSETPELPGSRGWGALFPRTVTWARLKLRQRPAKSLVFFNTHFDYLGPEVTVPSARLLQARIAKIAGRQPALLCGDFNAEKDSPAYQVLASTRRHPGPRLHDVYRSLHPAGEDEGTFHAYGAQNPETSIDWLLASHHWRALEARIDRQRRCKRYPSDHHPLLAVLEF